MLEAEQLQRTTTADGSTTLKHLDLNVLYRSDQGALGESEHVFLAGTRLTQRHEPWRVLELGFGTGQNFLATAQAARTQGQNLHYVAIDAAPIPPEFVTSSSADAAFVQSLLARAREEDQTVSAERSGIYLTLHPYRWQDTPLSLEPVHSIFHDPFAPDINPDCWTRAAFAWGFSNLRPDGLLATYSAAGRVRRAMRDAGYVVARAPGYGKKREMTLASPTEEALLPHPIKYRP